MSPQAPLLGITAIGRRLGVSRQRAHVLVGRADFPGPAQHLPTGRLWREPDVERWAAAHPRYDHTAELPRCPTCGQIVEATA